MEISPGLEQEMMLAIIKLHPDAYGVSIKALLNEQISRDYSIGAIYSGLERLEDKGFISSRQGTSEPKRGGRKKLLFVVTGKGREVLKESLRPLDTLRKGLGIGEGVFA